MGFFPSQRFVLSLFVSRFFRIFALTKKLMTLIASARARLFLWTILPSVISEASKRGVNLFKEFIFSVLATDWKFEELFHSAVV